ncbi:MAG: FAD-dependent oxidoreductase [Rhodoferax sp.]|jgi:squalene-associated FAD-dependent desaturase|nr:FAD-dependent oxidoreductase [Rhodoferax sp.]
MKIAIVGAGWAGLTAAVTALLAGHEVTVLEAGSSVGGRARALPATLPDGRPVLLDNGQHILIGAYAETLRMLRVVGVDVKQALLNLPMTLQFPDGAGLRFPDWPTPLDALAGIVGARGWSLADKWCLLRAATSWQYRGFECPASLSVAELCQPLTARVQAELIEPLCVSALNTPASQASASVFLRVLRDALFGVAGGSHLLLPATDLGALYPVAAADWIGRHGGCLHLKARVQSIHHADRQWSLHGTGMDQAANQPFAAVILATSASNTALALMQSALTATTDIANQLRDWATTAGSLSFEAIATVYAWAPAAALPRPMLALRSDAACPAQFVFDRAQLGGPAGLLAFVASAAQGSRQTLQASVLAQAQRQLALTLQAVQTVVEKRATFACTPGLIRPAQAIAPGLLACGDYVAGPYPATLEGAVMSGIAAVAALHGPGH